MTTAEMQFIVDNRTQKTPVRWEVIAQKIGRTVKSCQDHYGELRQKGVHHGVKMPAEPKTKPPMWTQFDGARAAQIFKREVTDQPPPATRAGGHDMRKRALHLIARELGRTYDAVRGRFLSYGTNFMAKPRTNERPSSSYSVHLQAAARANAAARRDLTAASFGDPPPGYSALDEWRAQGRVI